MDNDTKKIFRTLGVLSTAGMAMAFSIAIGVLVGHYLDEKFNTKPWFFIIFLIFGIVAAFKNLFYMYKKAKEIDGE